MNIFLEITFNTLKKNIVHCVSHGVKSEVHQVQKKNKLTVTRYVQNIRHIGTNTQACWPLVNCVINQRLL